MDCLISALYNQETSVVIDEIIRYILMPAVVLYVLAVIYGEISDYITDRNKRR